MHNVIPTCSVLTLVISQDGRNTDFESRLEIYYDISNDAMEHKLL